MKNINSINNKGSAESNNELISFHYSITKKNTPMSLEIPLPSGSLRLYFEYFNYLSSISELAGKADSDTSARVVKDEPLDESTIEFSDIDEDASKLMRLSNHHAYSVDERDEDEDKDDEEEEEEYLNFFDSSVIL